MSEQLEALAREIAALRRDVQRLAMLLVERKTTRQVRTAARYRLIRQAGEILGPDLWRSAGKLAKLLAGQDVAFGELGDLVARIRRDPEGAREQRRLWEIMAMPGDD